MFVLEMEIVQYLICVNVNRVTVELIVSSSHVLEITQAIFGKYVLVMGIAHLLTIVLALKAHQVQCVSISHVLEFLQTIVMFAMKTEIAQN
jgi:hypothetical protein